MRTNMFARRPKNNNGMHRNLANPFRIGERVKSRRFGDGVVRAFNPNGTMLVRFDGRSKNQSIFPTLLEKNVH